MESLIRLSPVRHFLLQLCGCIVGLWLHRDWLPTFKVMFTYFLHTWEVPLNFIISYLPQLLMPHFLLFLPEYAISESLVWRKCCEALRTLLFYPFAQHGAEVGRHRTECGKCWKYIVTKNGVLQAYAYQIWNTFLLFRMEESNPFAKPYTALLNIFNVILFTKRPFNCLQLKKKKICRPSKPLYKGRAIFLKRQSLAYCQIHVLHILQASKVNPSTSRTEKWVSSWDPELQTCWSGWVQ